MNFVKPISVKCDCTPAPGLPTRPGMESPTHPSAKWQADGKFTLTFGKWANPTDVVRNFEVYIADLGGALVTDDAQPFTVTAEFVDRGYQARVTVNPTIQISEGMFQVVLMNASKSILHAAYLSDELVG